MNWVRRIGIGIALAVVLSLAVVLLVPPSSMPGVVCEVGGGELTMSAGDLSAVSQPVAEDAARLATELFGDCQEKCDDFANQLLATFLEAKEKDFVILFNSGGWGSNLLEASPGWSSILNGIEAELCSLDYTLLPLVYLRTEDSLRGHLDELKAMITHYWSEADDLACRVEFLTSHIPDLRVIITGESNGTVISDRVMSILEDEPQVYSIQTGPPFWYKNFMLDRTLLLTSNGIIPDSFSQGDFWTVAWGNLRCWLHLSQSVDDFGVEPHYIGAPGHDYWWQYPEVCSQITNFLDENFGIK